MTSEKENIIPNEQEKPSELASIKPNLNSARSKDPKRIAAGKKGAEAKKLKAELKRKEMEQIKKENMELNKREKPVKQITKDDDLPIITNNTSNTNNHKNYIPLCIAIGVVGLGLYVYKSELISTGSKQVTTMIKQQPTIQKKEKEIERSKASSLEIDPFQFN